MHSVTKASTLSMATIIKKLKSCRTGLANHTGSIYHHWLLMPLDQGHTCTHTNAVTKAISRNQVHARQCSIGLKNIFEKCNYDFVAAQYPLYITI